MTKKSKLAKKNFFGCHTYFIIMTQNDLKAVVYYQVICPKAVVYYSGSILLVYLTEGGL